MNSYSKNTHYRKLFAYNWTMKSDQCINITLKSIKINNYKHKLKTIL